MPGCCLGAIVLFFGPRVLLFSAWLLSNWYSAFESRGIALLGFLFLPWTSLAWMFVFFSASRSRERRIRAGSRRGRARRSGRVRRVERRSKPALGLSAQVASTTVILQFFQPKPPIAESLRFPRRRLRRAP